MTHPVSGLPSYVASDHFLSWKPNLKDSQQRDCSGFTPDSLSERTAKLLLFSEFRIKSRIFLSRIIGNYEAGNEYLCKTNTLR